MLTWRLLAQSSDVVLKHTYSSDVVQTLRTKVGGPHNIHFATLGRLQHRAGLWEIGILLPLTDRVGFDIILHVRFLATNRVKRFIVYTPFICKKINPFYNQVRSVVAIYIISTI